MFNHLFPTTVIGSLPRPEWLREVILDRKNGVLSETETTALIDRVIDEAILIQERAGLEEITDGEWRRESYVKVFAERVRGFENDLNISDIPYPAVVAPVEYYRPIALDELEFLRPRTARRVKVTLPSPYIIGRRMWHEEHSTRAYPTRESLMSDCVGILREEIGVLKEAKADTIQLDEPWLSAMVDPAFRQREGVSEDRWQYERDLCADLINQTVVGFEDVEMGMHLCHAHFAHKHGTEGPYDLIMDTLAKISIGTISMEYATPVAGGMETLKQFPKNARLGLGCIDHCDREIETPEKVVARVEEAMDYVDKERITLHPDCGFAPSVQNPMDLDQAYLKLRTMCEAAIILRDKHA